MLVVRFVQLIVLGIEPGHPYSDYLRSRCSLCFEFRLSVVFVVFMIKWMIFVVSSQTYLGMAVAFTVPKSV